MNQLYAYISPLPHEPPSHLPHPTPLGGNSALNWAPCVIQQLPTSYLLYRWMDKDMVHICNGIFVVVAVQSLSHVWLCHPMDCSMPGFPVLHHLLELAQKACPLSGWHHPIISSSVVPFCSHLQSFPASGSFPTSQFSSGDQSFGASASVQWIFRTDFL